MSNIWDAVKARDYEEAARAAMEVARWAVDVNAEKRLVAAAQVWATLAVAKASSRETLTVNTVKNRSEQSS